MQADLPHTLYLGRDGVGDEAPRKKTKASAEVIRLQEEANRKAARRRARQAQEEPPVTIEELFHRDKKK